MTEIILKVVTRKEIDLNLNKKEMIAFPVYECRQWIFEEKIIIVQYRPVNTLGFNEKEFIDLVKKQYKKDLNAHSVEVVERKDKGIDY